MGGEVIVSLGLSVVMPDCDSVEEYSRDAASVD